MEVPIQLQKLFSQRSFAPKKWMSNKQLVFEPNTEGSLDYRLILLILILKRAEGPTKNELNTLITQNIIMSLVSFLFRPIVLFALISVHVRRPHVNLMHVN